MTEQERHPGQWPVDSPVDLDASPAIAQRQRYNAHRARFEITLGSVRADLEEQPSEASVRAAARRWQNAITAIADETVAQLRKAG
ncbi:hypothetical protein [Streptomyces sp. SYSU K21746]